MRLLVLAALMMTGAAAGNGPAASFDCAKAATGMEKLICSDPDLATADATLATVYGKIISANPAYADALRDGQRAFLSTRAPCLTGARTAQIACVKRQYQDRIEALQRPNLVTCAKPKLAAAAFTMTCFAPNHPLRIAAVLSGTKDGSDATLTDLAVTTARGKQTFKLDGRIFFAGLGTALGLTDVNFDGFADLQLTVSSTAGPNMEYAYWLFDPKSGRFVASAIGDQLSGFDVMPDPKTRTIAVNARDSCCEWSLSTYAWKGGALKLITTLDTGVFSGVGLPGMDNFQGMICGEETMTYNDAGLITRIDLALDSGADLQCEEDDLAAQAKVLETIKRAKGFRLEVKDQLHFAIVFDKPKKPE